MTCRSEAEVRVARRDDVPVLVELMAEFYAEAGYALPREAATRTFTTLLEDARLGRVWLVKHGGAPVGYLVVTLAFSMELGGLRGFLDDFFVRPSARGRGLGTVALETARQACHDLGARALLVDAGREGHPARRLYARAGFVDSGRVLLTRAFAPAVHEA